MIGPADRELSDLMVTLRDRLALSRATLRLDVPADQPMPMTHEALAQGVASVGGVVVAAEGSPTVATILRTRALLAVPDTDRAVEVDPAFDDDSFRAMVRDYGGLAAFVAAPVFEQDQLVGILSLHQLSAPRNWTEDELEIARRATGRITQLRPELVRERER